MGARSSVCEAYSPVDAETGALEPGRILVLKIEQVIDACEQLDLLVDQIVRRKVDDRVARRGEARDREIAVGVDPRPDVKHGRGELELLGRREEGRETRLVAR